jgi:hypothetical protein
MNLVDLKKGLEIYLKGVLRTYLGIKFIKLVVRLVPKGSDRQNIVGELVDRRLYIRQKGYDMVMKTYLYFLVDFVRHPSGSLEVISPAA